MLRSLITLLILINLNVGFMPARRPVSVFNPLTLIDVATVPVKNSMAVAPVIEAKAAMVMDMDSGAVLYGKAIRARMPMASLTKIMTAVVILENHGLNEVVKVKNDFKGLEGVRMRLKKYEQITIENLLMGLLIPSAGDAALALAEYHSGSVGQFVEEMNRKAQALGLADTHFTNPIGLDEEGHYSSAHDLAILTKYALHFPVFRRIIGLPEAEVKSFDGGITHSFKNTNRLLGSYLDIRGVKTGTTDEAGQSLINLAVSANGHQIIAILLNSANRFQENKGLMDWVFRSYLW